MNISRPYAALQNGNECFCFNQIVDNIMAQDDSDCSAVCAGHDNEICGESEALNYRRLSVYNGRQHAFCSIHLG